MDALVCHVRERRLRRDESLAGQTLSADDVRRYYDQHGPALVAYACSFVADASAAEDAVHQVFLRLLRGNTQTPDAPLAYLYRAVRNAALNLRRNGKRDVPIETQDSCFVHRGGNREAALALQAALGELPEEQREAVVMRTWSGMTLEEISVATGTPLNTVASRYRYALEKLRERLQPYRGLQKGKE
jgi:RNA polymerase sigma-70 factor, ECF subfamily